MAGVFPHGERFEQFEIGFDVTSPTCCEMSVLPLVNVLRTAVRILRATSSYRANIPFSITLATARISLGRVDEARETGSEVLKTNTNFSGRAFRKSAFLQK